MPWQLARILRKLFNKVVWSVLTHIEDISYWQTLPSRIPCEGGRVNTRNKAHGPLTIKTFKNRLVTSQSPGSPRIFLCLGPSFRSPELPWDTVPQEWRPGSQVEQACACSGNDAQQCEVSECHSCSLGSPKLPLNLWDLQNTLDSTSPCPWALSLHWASEAPTYVDEKGPAQFSPGCHWACNSSAKFSNPDIRAHSQTTWPYMASSIISRPETFGKG